MESPFRDVKCTVVTSFTEEVYETYAKAFLDSFAEHWPANVGLVVYYEGGTPPGGHGVEWRAYGEVVGLADWETRIAPFSLMSGMNGHEYDINFDARMARKAFIQCHGARTLRGKVFWIDADVIAHAPVPDTFLDEVLPDDKMCCFLGRDGWCYTESGFIGFNTDHQACPTFMAAYLGAFTSGAIFTQPGWHDCHGFDMARRAFDPALFVNLATGLPEGCMHPFVNSVLGRYMDHRKGPRKESRTSREDLLIDRSEAYWRG